VEKKLARLVPLREAFAVKSLPPRAKKRIVAILFKGEIQNEVLFLLYVLIERGRDAYLSKVIEHYSRKLCRIINAVEVQAVTAAPLSRDFQDRLEKSLCKTLGKNVLLTASLDPELLGGFKLITGSGVLDMSVRGCLESMARKMREAPLGAFADDPRPGQAGGFYPTGI
jgi:F-type H+-transporting ATPase subunit delta